MRAMMVRVERWRDLIVAADPGLTWFRMGARACISAGAATLALWELSKWIHKPIRESLIGVMIAMTSAIAVNDPSPRAQKMQMAIVPCVAVATVTMGTVTAAYSSRVTDAVFMAVIFATVFARHFGRQFVELGLWRF